MPTRALTCASPGAYSAVLLDDIVLYYRDAMSEIFQYVVVWLILALGMAYALTRRRADLTVDTFIFPLLISLPLAVILVYLRPFLLPLDELISYVVIAWVVLALAVAYGATHRGRLAFDWFVLAIVISPPIAAILLYLRPVYIPLGVVDRPATPGSPIPISDPFLPDDHWLGVPYRTLTGGYVDAMFRGGIVRFRDINQMKAAVEAERVAAGLVDRRG
jgi:hypothetical protein